MAPALVDLAMILLYPPRFTFIFSFLFSFCSSACCKLSAWFSRKTENWKILQVPVGIRFANKTEWNKKKTEQNIQLMMNWFMFAYSLPTLQHLILSSPTPSLPFALTIHFHYNFLFLFRFAIYLVVPSHLISPSLCRIVSLQWLQFKVPSKRKENCVFLWKFCRCWA